MQLLNKITINKSSNATIELLHGDLSAIPAEHAIDILVVSAYPGSYVPLQGTLMAALYNKGLSIEEMAKDKEIDLLDQLGCWLSKPLSKDQQGKFNLKRILCFEPRIHPAAPEEIVGNIFRCISTFAFDKQNNVVAMPMVASGNQKVALEKMLPAILNAAIF